MDSALFTYRIRNRVYSKFNSINICLLRPICLALNLNFAALPAEDEDEPASPASTLLKTYDNFKAKFEFIKQRFEDLAVEEQNLKQEFESRLTELEVCRAALIADQDKELKLR